MKTDREFLRLLRDNPEKGLEELMGIHTGLVYAIVYGKLADAGTREDIEECVSDVFYEFYRNINAVDLQKGSIKAYLSVISKRRAIDAFRRISKAPGEPDSEIFILKYFFGLSTKSIARRLRLKENTVDKKVSRGRDKLRILLTRRE